MAQIPLGSGIPAAVKEDGEAALVLTRQCYHIGSKRPGFTKGGSADSNEL